jgi:enoyl-CoA hydratase
VELTVTLELPKLDYVEVSWSGPIAQLVLNRPDKRNAINAAMLQEIGLALGWIAAQPNLRVTVLRGNGPSFSSGFDVAAPANSDDEEYGGHDSVHDYLDLRNRIEQLFAVWQHPKPVIAAVHGHCLGAATMLAALADLTLVAENVRIGIPTLPLGGGLLTPTWVHLVGPKRAKQIAFQVGSAMSATEAVAWGFANYAVASEDLQEEAERLAASIARTPLSLLILKKAAINRMVELSGFSVGAQIGALTDSVAHGNSDIDAVRASIKDVGVKRTVEAFVTGQLDT